MIVHRRHVIALSALALAVVAGVWSYLAGGTVRVLIDSAGALGDSGQSLDALRAALDRWGRLAPAAT